MIRMALFLIVGFTTINAVLLTAGIIGDWGAFANLTTAINQIDAVGATLNLNEQGVTQLSAGDVAQTIPLIISLVLNTGIAFFKLIILLSVGYINVLNIIDPTASWSLILIVPVAVIQLAAYTFLGVQLTAMILGARAV